MVGIVSVLGKSTLNYCLIKSNVFNTYWAVYITITYCTINVAPT